MKHTVRSIAFSLLGTSIALSAFAAEVNVEITMPSGSASNEYGEDITGAAVFTPCLKSGDTSLFGGNAENSVSVDNLEDQLLITITGSVDDDLTQDLYFMLVNVGATAAGSTIDAARFFSFQRWEADTGAGAPRVQIKPFDIPTSINAAVTDYVAGTATDGGLPYLRNADILEGEFEEIVMGGNIFFDDYSLPEGTWLAFAMIAESDSIDFEDPTTWGAWDGEYFILGSPWPNDTNTRVCD